MQFTVTTAKPGPLEIEKLLERHANSLWVPDHLDDDQAAAFVLDHFRRQIESDLAMVPELHRLAELGLAHWTGGHWELTAAGSKLLPRPTDGDEIVPLTCG
jgi:hypothetical protein